MATASTATARSGFTLLELTVVLAVLSLLLAIALPTVSAALPGIYLDQAARSLAADTQLARVKAIARNTRTRIVIQLDQGSYQVESERNGAFTPEGAPRALPGGIAFDAADSSRVVGNRISIIFQPRGNTSNNATIALVSSNGADRQVVVSSAGRVRIQ